MIRFPNPGSNVDNIAEIFAALYNDLSSHAAFDLDDMSKTMVKHNLAASCGRMGVEALQRSSRSDRSRDPLYNQSKMYSEVYRALGWITSTEESRLTFQFTILGAHVSRAAGSIKHLMRECFLGMVYPNPMLDMMNQVSLRPFKTFLYAMRDLDGFISRDELIFGPMHLQDDKDEEEYASMIKDVKSCRLGRNLTSKLEAKLVRRNISLTTARNYTRFPLAVLKWSGWAKRVFKRIYVRAEPFFALTSDGYNQIEAINKLKDFRRSDFNHIPKCVRGALITSCFYKMLGSCGFNTKPLNSMLDSAHQELRDHRIDIKNILFSPLEELTPKEISQYKCLSPIVSGKLVGEEADSVSNISNEWFVERSGSASFNAVLVKSNPETRNSELDRIWSSSNHDIATATSNFVNEHINDNKDVFYPLVARLFNLCGFPCEVSRNGVNYQRADATITLQNGLLIPIEIKSPGEEIFISVKAVRQAVENRIILLSRQPKQSRRDLTSLVVGFSYPNDRAEVNELLSDFSVAFGFNIGIISFPLLVTMAFSAVYNGKKLSPSDMEKIHGFFSIHP